MLIVWAGECGDRRRGSNGTVGPQQCRHPGCLPLATAGAALRTVLAVISGNSAARRGDALRACLSTPRLRLRLVNLPSYSPHFNADQAIRAGCAGK